MSHDDWIIHIRSGLASVANCHANVANGQKDSGVLAYARPRPRSHRHLPHRARARAAMSGSAHCTQVTSRVHQLVLTRRWPQKQKGDQDGGERTRCET